MKFISYCVCFFSIFSSVIAQTNFSFKEIPSFSEKIDFCKKNNVHYLAIDTLFLSGKEAKNLIYSIENKDIEAKFSNSLWKLFTYYIQGAEKLAINKISKKFAVYLLHELAFSPNKDWAAVVLLYTMYNKEELNNKLVPFLMLKEEGVQHWRLAQKNKDIVHFYYTILNGCN